MESVGYCVRVQALDGYVDRISALILHSDYTAVLSVKHKGKSGENPHYHIVLRTAIKAQAFRVRMKSVFHEGKGNQHMSIRPFDGDDKALSYLFHEDRATPVVARKGITDEYLDKIKQLADEIGAKVTQAKTKSAHTLFDDALVHFGKSNPSPLAVSRIPDETIGEWMILYALREGKYSPEPWRLRAMVLKCKFYLLKGNVAAEEEFACQIARNIYHRE